MYFLRLSPTVGTESNDRSPSHSFSNEVHKSQRPIHRRLRTKAFSLSTDIQKLDARSTALSGKTEEYAIRY